MPRRTALADVCVDVLVIGTGPSALTLSYLLHGNTPVYEPPSAHSPPLRRPDPALHTMLSSHSDNLYGPLLHNLRLQRHLARLHTAAAPANVISPANYLLDALAAPDIDINIADARANSCLSFVHRPEHARDHVVIGSSFMSGGQWASRDTPSRTLSYADMLSLPGYSFPEFCRDTGVATDGGEFDPYLRPQRADVAAYYAAYPPQVGIEDSLLLNYTVLSLQRVASQLHPHKFIAIIQCNDTGRLHMVTTQAIVLASGVFTHLVPPDPMLYPFFADKPEATVTKPPYLALSTTTPSVIVSPSEQKSSDDERDTVLIIGSGFSAADAILSVPASRKIVHMFKWDPKSKPSPLRSCHRELYPEYAYLYRLMKSAVGLTVKKSKLDAGDNMVLGFGERYEGVPNGTLLEARHGQVKIQLADGSILQRSVAEVKAYIGRIGVISYLSSSLRQEIGIDGDQIWATKMSFRKRICSRAGRWTALSLDGRAVDEQYYSLTEDMDDDDDDDDDDTSSKQYITEYAASHGFEVADGVFVIGSLVGDSLVRYTLGGCVVVAGNLIERCRAL
ncbi:uncharacterized protein V1518DRAFT_441938 [Limtongia smithiae]|uniref:uncharacterized protein n=1 Tax=Limtongia smithiae TaxID=1125753 RepID=UPI0034CF81A2